MRAGASEGGGQVALSSPLLPPEAMPAPRLSPRQLLVRRLVHNRTALISLIILSIVVLGCAAAPLYSRYVAHTGPNVNHLSETLTVGGETVEVVSSSKVSIVDGMPTLEKAGGVPVGPLWWKAGGRFVLGADENGRDLAVRLLYGGRTSLRIGLGAALVSVSLGLLLALWAGSSGGWIDWVTSRLFDILWAFPSILLAIAVGTALSLYGFSHFGITIDAGSLTIPTLLIGFVLVPYVGRPIRGQVLSLRQKEFVEAAVAQGASAPRVMFKELLPNVLYISLVFFTLVFASCILLEAGLSYLGAGVQRPSSSWGTLIADGQARIVTAPWLSIFPGLVIVVVVLAVNMLGEALRQSLDMRTSQSG